MAVRGLRPDDFYTDSEVRDVVSRQRELNFTPGAEYLYSNSGYFLLGQIILEATGTSLSEYAEAKIFGPLGMSHSHFHDDHNHIVENRATGYAPERGGFRISQTTLDMVGDGGVFTSIEDLVHWVNALNDDSLDKGLTPMLETRAIMNSGDTFRYAFGQSHGEYRGLRTVGHGGAFVGFRADITRFPDQATSIMTICNRGDSNPTGLARQVADVVLADQLGAPEEEESQAGQAGVETPRPGPVSNPEDYVGHYFSPELNVEYVLSMDGEALRLRVGSGIDGQLSSLGNDELFLDGVTLRFSRDAGGVTGFEVDAGRVQHVVFEKRSSGM